MISRQAKMQKVILGSCINFFNEPTSLQDYFNTKLTKGGFWHMYDVEKLTNDNWRTPILVTAIFSVPVPGRAHSMVLAK
jgi:hypothetical protein